ncbi:MAG: hypothetical protein ACREL5_09950, partial [Gemmatimonadales bacterium]
MIPVAVAAMLASCGHPTAPAERHGPPIEHRLTTATLDSLPTVTPNDGRLVCLAAGSAPCPKGPARANWFPNGKFATWEALGAAELWTAGQVDPVRLGDIGTADGQYS